MTSNNPLRVLHVVPSIGRQSGGLTSAVAGLVAALRDISVDAAIVTTDLATAPQAKKARLHLTDGDLPDRYSDLHVSMHHVRFPHRLVFSPDLYRYVHRHIGEYDILHIHGLFLFPQFAAHHAAKAAGKPFLVSTHGMLSPHLRRKGVVRKKLNDILWQERMLRSAARIHANSDVERDGLRDLNFGSPVEVIPNGLDISRFTQDADGDRFRHRHGYTPETLLVVNHGRLSRVKGLDVLIDALPEVLERHPAARVVIIGPDDEGMTVELRARAERLGVAGSLDFLPGLQGADLADAIAAADVWTLLSHSDSFGLAALEAMSLARACVVSRHVGVAPYGSKANALMMIDSDTDQASQAISELLSSPQARHDLGTSGRWFSEDYDWSSIAGRFVELYADIIDECKSRHM